MNFEQEFENWLEEGLKGNLPNNIKAFSFNLFEPAFEDGVTFGIELIGAGEFSENDTDWACDEVWEPKQRNLFIPVEYSGKDWESCLEIMKKLIFKTLNKEKEFSKKLKESKGVGIGFVDGDLSIVWQP